MPVAKTHLLSGRSVDEKRAIGDAVQAALVDVVEIPGSSLFQVFAEYSGTDFGYNTDAYPDAYPSDQFLLIEIALTDDEVSDDETKKALLQAINANLVAKNLVNNADDDVFVVITEVPRANMGSGAG